MRNNERLSKEDLKVIELQTEHFKLMLENNFLRAKMYNANKDELERLKAENLQLKRTQSPVFNFTNN